jgi:uncharacterized protein
MSEVADPVAAPVAVPVAAPPTRIDACVTPMPRTADEIREYLDLPWRVMAFPGPEDYDHVAARPPYLDPSPDGTLPASDPQAVHRRTVVENGTDVVVLVPRTRGLLPNLDLAAEICAATNRWLAARWLDGPHGAAFRGTIRVDPRDPARAVAEIEQWAGHPRMVQVGVPTQAVAPYGHRQYLPVWEAASALDLPVVVARDGGSGIHFHPTLAGRAKYLVEKEVLYPANFAFHVASLLAEGVFERFPALRVVFADGGHALLPPILWRLQKDWRGNRPEVPWIRRAPGEYVEQHVRFCTDGLGAVPAGAEREFWLGLGHAERILLYASHYPHWAACPPDAAVDAVAPATAAAVLGGNAARLYHL